MEFSKYFIAQIVGTLAFLRSKSIVHRDLKPANFLINKNFQIQLNTFRTAIHSSLIVPPNGQSEDLSLVGSACYVSPEILTNRSYSYSSDIWAVGIIIYHFFVGKNPFRGKTKEKTFELIKNCEYKIPDCVPEKAKNLIQQILVKEPEKRIGAKNIEELINHEFFTSAETKELTKFLESLKTDPQ